MFSVYPCLPLPAAVFLQKTAGSQAIAEPAGTGDAGRFPGLDGQQQRHDANLAICRNGRSDDGFITDATWASVSVTNRNAYAWDREVFNDLPRNDWSYPYTVVFTLTSCSKAPQNTATAAQYGEMCRARPPFSAATPIMRWRRSFVSPTMPGPPNTDPGLVLRPSSGLNARSVRSTVLQSYRQMISDFTLAAAALPIDVAAKTRPGKSAAFAMLARTYLVMADYAKAYAYADSCLKLMVS
jgi:hypothetical protein